MNRGVCKTTLKHRKLVKRPVNKHIYFQNEKKKILKICILNKHTNTQVRMKDKNEKRKNDIDLKMIITEINK